jgi:hypothetical protein
VLAVAFLPSPTIKYFFIFLKNQHIAQQQSLWIPTRAVSDAEETEAHQ